MYAIVQSGAIDVAEIEERVVASHRGAVVSFIGLVRDHHQGRSVHALEYDAYGPMAVKTLRDIVAEAESRWQVEAAVVHRVGLHASFRPPVPPVTGDLDLQVIDAVSHEDVFFSGRADVGWNNPHAGDIRTSNADRRWLFERLDIYLGAGLPVFTLDYALIPANIDEAYRRSRARGYVPFVSRTPLDRLP